MEDRNGNSRQGGAEGERRSIPSWLFNTSIVGLIFLIGGYVARLEMQMASIADMKQEIAVIQKAISIHHGQEWSSKALDGTLKKVDELSVQLDNLATIYPRVEALHLWTEQADDVVEKARLESFTAEAGWRKSPDEEDYDVLINAAHEKARQFEIGDSIALRNPNPPHRKLEATVVGFWEDHERANLLVQMNEKLVDELSLNRDLGKFPIIVIPSVESIDWKSVEDFLKDKNSLKEM